MTGLLSVLVVHMQCVVLLCTLSHVLVHRTVGVDRDFCPTGTTPTSALARCRLAYYADGGVNQQSNNGDKANHSQIRATAQGRPCKHMKPKASRIASRETHATFPGTVCDALDLHWPSLPVTGTRKDLNGIVHPHLVLLRHGIAAHYQPAARVAPAGRQRRQRWR